MADTLGLQSGGLRGGWQCGYRSVRAWQRRCDWSGTPSCSLIR